MKGFLIVSLMALCLRAEDPKTAKKDDAATPKDHKPEAVCNPVLLATFKLNRAPVAKDTKCLPCKGISEENNCCSYFAQHQMVRLWAKGSERSTIVEVYRNFVDVYRDIFGLFVKIEVMAQTIADAKADEQDSPCGNLAKAVTGAKFSGLQTEVLKAAKAAFNFLYEARKGFYCSLCDKRVHQLYQADSEVIPISYTFCKEMVQETLPFYAFKHLHFMKMARLYGELMSKCTIEGEFRPNDYLAHQAIFVTKADHAAPVALCRDRFNKGDGFSACRGFCEAFHPLKFHRLLEGDLGKTTSFARILKTLVDSKIGVVKTNNKDALFNVTENTKRLLAERSLSESSGRALQDAKKPGAAAPGPADKKADGPKNGFNAFNAGNNTSLVPSLTYNFAFDMAAKSRTNFEYSYLQTSHHTKYHMGHWQVKMRKVGVNYSRFGKATFMTKAVAVEVFKLANPKAVPAVAVAADAPKTDAQTPPASPASPAKP